MVEEIVGERVVHAGPKLVLRVATVRLPNGRTTEREIVQHRGAAAIVARDGDGTVVLTAQYRTAVGRDLVELPAGTLEEGEDPEACARRELREETGFTARRWRKLGVFYPAPGYTTELIHLYLATDLAPGRQSPDDAGRVAVRRLGLAEALRMVEEGTIVDAKTIIGLAWAREPPRTPPDAP
jgi:ADP-ribose pyrophosphatase